MTDQLKDSYDVVVIGGGAAGLNGALMLARSRRSVVVIDSGAPRNAPAAHAHGMLARDGMPPAEILERGRAEVRGYGGQVVTGEVVAVAGTDTGAGANADAGTPGFLVTLADGRVVSARRLLVTTGLVDELPDIPGVRERWGKDVLHCPYCHGWEVRDQAVGILGGGPMSVHQALLFRQLTANVTFFTHTGSITPEQSEQLAAREIRVINGAVTALEIGDDRLTGVRVADGTVTPVEALAIPTRMVARGAFLNALGLHPVEHPSGAGEHIPTDPMGRTTVPGIWAAGNVTDLSAQVGNAAAAGAFAGAQINADLVGAETAQAVAARAARLSPAR
ncbi:NAD(P)/FAD-dependent oxidoreductase [Nocardia huaxiensis]|uniref:NAD(P)/FAD-dependent oxidoreductase n=1 Tax=Nocardia huaxiensis TaxID=2755382 RepID=A0A7D6ZJD4_9NOCA|nr:NAD(P)/FAD-dependent oxidoreductase [Nocardia huaxiensis]QLY32439.1 NAD(P)/FAD-dependent oxidoreductase [Nocardia huaxiensis]